MSPKVVAVCFQSLAKLSRRVRRRFVCGSREISLAPSLHRASTDALMSMLHWVGIESNRSKETLSCMTYIFRTYVSLTHPLLIVR